MLDNIQSNSGGWLFFVKTSFAIALLATTVGILFAPIDLLVKGYMGICALFLVSTTITLSKTMRDEHESQRLIHKISEAKTKQLIKEFAE
ncbi:MAG TPA: YiaA/YiaB family inner membrane protein [Dongiaceae bacterium]|nr:YiaA/YiaB family inner membrane protein [Dongiaceae bacterium]